MRCRLTTFFSAASSYTTSSGPKHISQTCVAWSSYSAPHSRQRRPRSLAIRVSLDGGLVGTACQPLVLGDGRNREHAAVVRAHALPLPLVNHPVVPKAQKAKVGEVGRSAMDPVG